ncbi:AAA family ATPase [Rhizobacter sp. Root404]|uniref:AAA family ATPase n=1 Tax=Rhizobacter sp. Root404 TaxID=1736528 RepID=UPI0009E8EFC4|nr:AAA family ATPase [Rhizobacter sp. Root404]
MKCGSCGCATRDGLRFCEACGTALEKKCPGCGATASAVARFCGTCGSTFRANPSAPALVATPAEESPPILGDGERRQLTVMFADVVGATVLSGHLDPEALRALLRAYQHVCVECTERYGGHIHQYAGDGVLAYFGYPAAHDDDAERAVLAGLAIVEGTQRLALDLRQRGEEAIAVRVGIHTGLVVVGEMGAGNVREVHAIGETPNIAARIQGEAAADSVCISAATARLLGPRFPTRSMGARPLKGVARELNLFAIDAAFAASGPEARRPTATLVGREKELLHLQERWTLARSGHGQAVLISGEGGIGKSCLLAAFRESAGADGPAWRNVFCSPFFQNSALHPMIDLIERGVLRDSGDSPAERSGALSRALEVAGLGDETTFALLASLLGVAGANEESLHGLAPDQRKRRTLDALIAWLGADAQQTPLVMLVEDLHWVDASTRDLLGTLLERIAQMPIMVVLTFRPEFVPAWALHGQVSTLPLSRLTPEQSTQVALGINGGKELPLHIVEAVARRTDGVPLFVEELTKAMIEAQVIAEREVPALRTDATAAALEVPATLRDSLTARLDRLGDAKMVAQVASVLGREFDYAVLHAICGLPHADLEERLAALNRAEIIHQRGVPPRSHYVFKHALIQESAYDTLLKSTRSQYHRLAANAYVQTFDELAQAHPELVAHHYSRALMPAQAIDYWQRAGDVAILRSGYSEAIGHLGAALEQLALLPESPERTKTELVLRVTIGPAFFATKSFAPETVDNYARASGIAETLGDSPEGFMALWGDWITKNGTSRMLEAARRTDDLVALARRLGNEEFVLQAHHARWTNSYMMGDARASRTDTLVGIRLYDRERHQHHRHIYGGHDPGICACGTGANAAWLTGYADEALQLADRAVAIAEEIEHPFSQSIACMWATLAACGTRDYARARERAETLLQLADRHSFPVWRGVAMVACGACRALAGETEFGLKLIGEGLVEQRRNGNGSWLGFTLVTAVTAHMQCGNLGRALELLTEGLAHAEKSHARVLLPEIERLHAEVQLLTGQIDTRQAILRVEAAATHARQQGALALEWRATMALARLYAGVGRDDEARAMLRGNYAAFTQGFSSPDLVEGKQLLDGMS